MKRRFLCISSLFMITCLLISAGLSYGQVLQTIKPEKAGFSPERLARIQPAVERWIEQKSIAGAVTLVARHGKIVQFGAYGMADIENKVPMKTDNIFRIMSMTKPVTSVAVMILLEDGLFQLDDPVSKFIPEFKNPRVIVPATDSIPEHLIPAKREITIRDLLNHTAGLSYGSGLQQKYFEEANIPELEKPEHTIEEFARAMGKVPLLFHPGESYKYSMSDDVLGYFVEVVSGMKYDKFCEEKIFKPLGMNDTSFFIPDSKLPRLAALYENTPDGGLNKFSPIDKEKASAENRKLFMGGQGLYSTAYDYALFCQMLLNKGELNGVRILSRKTVEGITVNSLGNIDPGLPEGGDKWGLGSVSVCSGTIHSAVAISQGAYMKSGAFSTYFLCRSQRRYVCSLHDPEIMDNGVSDSVL